MLPLFGIKKPQIIKPQFQLTTMIFNKYTTLLICILIYTSASRAQQLDVPRSSSKASVSQFIGVCEMKVHYARPSARGRKIYGELIPYGKVWRAGANEATVISFDQDVKFEGHLVKSGKYGLFVIPGENKWTVILNHQWNQWGAYHYDQNHDEIRFDVIPEKATQKEMFTIYFDGVDKVSGVMRLDWESLSVPIQLSTDTEAQTEKAIEEAVGEISKNWFTFSAAAQYYFYEKKEAEKALELIDMAIALDAPNPAPWMLKSQIKAYQKKYSEAISLAEEAIEVSNRHHFDFELEENESNIKKWKLLVD